MNMDECELCKKKEEDLTLLSVNHSDLGRLMVCQACWATLYEENLLVCDSTSSGNSCPTCR